MSAFKLFDKDVAKEPRALATARKYEREPERKRKAHVPTRAIKLVNIRCHQISPLCYDMMKEICSDSSIVPYFASSLAALRMEKVANSNSITRKPRASPQLSRFHCSWSQLKNPLLPRWKNLIGWG